MRTTLRNLLACAALTAALPAAAQQITGAGATDPAPLFAQWGKAAKAAIGIGLEYRAVGADTALQQMSGGTVDFAATDTPLDQSKLDQQNLVQFPAVMTAIVPIVNIPGVKSGQLKLSGDVLAAIFLGKVTSWDDTKITKLNKGLKLPHLPITPVHRADPCRATFEFTTYLSGVNQDWEVDVGARANVSWPYGTSAQGDKGVATAVANVQGGLGYVETTDLGHTQVARVQLRNQSGHFVNPTMVSFVAAAQSADWGSPQHFAGNIVNPPGQVSWPLVSPTYLLLPKHPKDPAQQQRVLRWLDWDYRNGDKIAGSLLFIPLPNKVKAMVRTTWKQELNWPQPTPLPSSPSPAGRGPG